MMVARVKKPPQRSWPWYLCPMARRDLGYARRFRTTKSCRLFAQRLRPTAFRKEKLVRFFLVRDVTSEAHVLKKLCREPVELVPCALMKLSFLHGDSQLR